MAWAMLKGGNGDREPEVRAWECGFGSRDVVQILGFGIRYMDLVCFVNQFGLATDLSGDFVFVKDLTDHHCVASGTLII